MTGALDIRETEDGDTRAIESLYRDAFPHEDLLPLVRDLLVSDALSLAGFVENALAGHVAFTPCTVAGAAGEAALLGPVAVAPQWQRQGVGSAIVDAGLKRLAHAGTARVFVLGDPAYYGRFGFETDDSVSPPYPLPEKWRGAWQSLSLSDDAPPLRGTLSIPPAWRRQALWAP